MKYIKAAKRIVSVLMIGTLLLVLASCSLGGEGEKGKTVAELFTVKMALPSYKMLTANDATLLGYEFEFNAEVLKVLSTGVDAADKSSETPDETTEEPIETTTKKPAKETKTKEEEETTTKEVAKDFTCIVQVREVDLSFESLWTTIFGGGDGDENLPLNERSKLLVVSGKSIETLKESDLLKITGTIGKTEPVDVDGVSLNLPHVNVSKYAMFDKVDEAYELYTIEEMQDLMTTLFGEGVTVEERTDMPAGFVVRNEKSVAEALRTITFIPSQSKAYVGEIQFVKEQIANPNFYVSDDLKTFYTSEYNTETTVNLIKAYSNKGEEKWTREIAADKAASIAITKKSVGVAVNSKLYILSLKTGEDQVPEQEVGNALNLQTINDQLLLVTGNAENNVKLLSSSGEEKWAATLKVSNFFVSMAGEKDNKILMYVYAREKADSLKIDITLAEFDKQTGTKVTIENKAV